MKAHPAGILDLLGVDYIERPNRLAMCCPWHHDTDPSSGFYLDSELWFCFACELTLTMSGFYAKMRDVSEQEALEELEKVFSVVPERKKLNRPLLARVRYKGEGLLKEVRNDFDRRLHAYFGEQLDRLLLLVEKGRISEEDVDKHLEIWYNKVNRS